jgi:protoporphyrinogen oxidase
MSENEILRVAIVGAGPAGLTAGLELKRRSRHNVIVLEALRDVGGLARTVAHRGNRMDIGGHRFFSKSAWVMNWWRQILPLPEFFEGYAPGKDPLQNLDEADRLAAMAPEQSLLARPRLSRIYYLRRFFDYPISLSLATLAKLGPARVLRIGLSYIKARLLPIKPEKNLADFLTNRFGRELYLTFFKDYTEKVWGVACERISQEWGAQRIKGLSIAKAILHALKKLANRLGAGVEQRNLETSLIERFLYPKYGPGQMWNAVADRFRELGGELRLDATLDRIELENGRVARVGYRGSAGERHTLPADIVISSMPIKDLMRALAPSPPEEMLAISDNLSYRDFITVGLLARKLRPTGLARLGYRNNLPPDTWIYIQEPGVKLGRLQVFNNWSPALVADPSLIWLGLEYFAREDDDLWALSETELETLAKTELEAIGLIDPADALDAHVVRAPKAYPAYFGAYERFGELRAYLDSLENLYLIGRNGMHRYNNQDHSMLAARIAVEGILAGRVDREKLWGVNAEQDYHEEKGA